MRAMQIPETYPAQIRWLESEMLGTQFFQLIAELEAVHGSQSKSFEFDEVLLERIREIGLSAMDPVDFQHLLTHPGQLLKIQQDMLINGGSFWSEVNPPAHENETLEKETFQFSTTKAQAISGSGKSPSLSSRMAWALAGALATAAALLLMLRPDTIGLQNRQNQPIAKRPSETEAQTADSSNAWGFARFAEEFEKSQQALEPPLDRKAYLSKLAGAAKAWSNKRPMTAAELAQRLSEFRRGCSQIILAKHEPIPEADRAWLRKRCREWASAIDIHLADVEAGQPVNEIVKSVDATVIKIAAALLGRAETPQEKTS